MAWAALVWLIPAEFTYTGAAAAAATTVAWWNKDEIIKWLNRQKRAVAAAFIGISVALFLLILASDVPAFNKLAYITAAGVFVACSALVMNLFVPFLHMTARELVLGDAGYEDQADFRGKVEALRRATVTMLEDNEENLGDDSAKQGYTLRHLKDRMPRAFTWTAWYDDMSIETPQWTTLPAYTKYEESGRGKLQKSEKLYKAFRQHDWVELVADEVVYKHMKFPGSTPALNHGSDDESTNYDDYDDARDGIYNAPSESDDYDDARDGTSPTTPEI
jgi:hypothetical protein